MRRSISDSILPLTLVATIFFLVSCITALVLFLPYDVHLKGVYSQDEEAIWYWVDKNGSETEYRNLRERQLAEGEGIRLSSDSVPTGHVEIQKERGGFAHLMAGSELIIESSVQHGKFWEHFRLSDELTYQLILKQTSGVVVYDFSQSDPPLANLNMVLRLPNGDYEPQSPCFQVTVTEADSSLVEIPCGNEVTPSEPLTLP